jgi:hypothetical protein
MGGLFPILLFCNCQNSVKQASFQPSKNAGLNKIVRTVDDLFRQVIGKAFLTEEGGIFLALMRKKRELLNGFLNKYTYKEYRFSDRKYTL